ncbi:hypothetical protein FRB99_004319 [Tulasnella sp. 403]|nr:hypothetical protein FRB99_004319 [Tulasnella sp. 403]
MSRASHARRSVSLSGYAVLCLAVCSTTLPTMTNALPTHRSLPTIHQIQGVRSVSSTYIPPPSDEQQHPLPIQEIPSSEGAEVAPDATMHTNPEPRDVEEKTEMVKRRLPRRRRAHP